jgi:hypothetical protein
MNIISKTALIFYIFIITTFVSGCLDAPAVSESDPVHPNTSEVANTPQTTDAPITFQKIMSKISSLETAVSTKLGLTPVPVTPIRYQPALSTDMNFAKRTIILRMDEVQGYAWNDVFINLTDEILNRNMSVVLGVIPYSNLENDTMALNYLMKIREYPNVEIAMHGTTHSSEEFSNLGENETYNLSKNGLDKIYSLLKVTPITFTPPNNSFYGAYWASENDVVGIYNEKGLHDAGFVYISAGRYGIDTFTYESDEYLNVAGYSTVTKYTENKSMNPLSGILTDCNKALDLFNTCIILINPADYAGSKNNFEGFKLMLDSLSTLNATTGTFAVNASWTNVTYKRAQPHTLIRYRPTPDNIPNMKLEAISTSYYDIDHNRNEYMGKTFRLDSEVFAIKNNSDGGYEVSLKGIECPLNRNFTDVRECLSYPILVNTRELKYSNRDNTEIKLKDKVVVWTKFEGIKNVPWKPHLRFSSLYWEQTADPCDPNSGRLENIVIGENLTCKNIQIQNQLSAERKREYDNRLCTNTEHGICV